MTTRTLSDICEIIQGGRRKLSGNDFVENGYPAFGAGGMNGYLPDFEFDQSAVILSSIGARCGKCFYAEGKWISLANTQLLFPDAAKADTKFLWYQLNDEARWPRSGSAQPFIKPSDVKRHQVFLPSLDEQRRIASILDQVGVLRRNRQKALARAGALNQAIMKSIVSKEAPLNTSKLIELVRSDDTINYGVVQPGDDLDDGIGLIRVANLVNADFRFESMKKIAPSIEAQYKRSRLRGDEILVGCVGSIGTIAMASPELAGCNIARAVARIPVDPQKVSREYLAEFLRSAECQRYFKSETRTVAQPTLNIKQLCETIVPLPDITVQEAFAAVSTAVDEIINCVKLSLARIDDLFAALRHRAFNGEL